MAAEKRRNLRVRLGEAPTATFSQQCAVCSAASSNLPNLGVLESGLITYLITQGWHDRCQSHVQGAHCNHNDMILILA